MPCVLRYASDRASYPSCLGRGASHRGWWGPTAVASLVMLGQTACAEEFSSATGGNGPVGGAAGSSTAAGSGGETNTTATGGFTTTSSTSTTSATTSTNGGGSGGGGGAGDTCSHPICQPGQPLETDCRQCVEEICAQDDRGCTSGWDSACVELVTDVCSLSCPATGLSLECNSLYGSLPGYRLCSETGSYCIFSVDAGQSCQAYCGQGPLSCNSAWAGSSQCKFDTSHPCDAALVGSQLSCFCGPTN